MDDFLHTDGFLGTRANLAADVTLILMIVIALLFTFGFFLARRERFNIHKWVQTLGALLNLALVLWLMVLPFRDFVVRDQGGPRLGIFYTITAIHGIIGTIAIVFGLFVVLRGHKLMPKFLQFNNYKPFMRAAYALYIGNTLIGIAVYYVWFVVEPNTPVYGLLEFLQALLAIA